jgi:hypothetical protein
MQRTNLARLGSQTEAPLGLLTVEVSGLGSIADRTFGALASTGGATDSPRA